MSEVFLGLVAFFGIIFIVNVTTQRKYYFTHNVENDAKRLLEISFEPFKEWPPAFGKIKQVNLMWSSSELSIIFKESCGHEYSYFARLRTEGDALFVVSTYFSVRFKGTRVSLTQFDERHLELLNAFAKWARRALRFGTSFGYRIFARDLLFPKGDQQKGHQFFYAVMDVVEKSFLR